MNKLHTPQRLADESFDAYKARRQASAERVALITCTLEPGGKNTSREILRANRRANRRAGKNPAQHLSPVDAMTTALQA